MAGARELPEDPAQLEYKQDALARTAPFKYLPRSELPEVARASRLVGFPVGGIVTRKGDSSKNVYIICKGHVHRDYLDGKAGSLLGPGVFFGDRAPLFNEPRRVNFTAVRSTSNANHGAHFPPPSPAHVTVVAGDDTVLEAVTVREATETAARIMSPPLSGEAAVVLLEIPGELFIDLVMTQLPFSVALARMLRTRQHLFEPLDSFQTFLFNSISSRSPSSSAANPSGLSTSATIDMKALLSFYRQMKPAVHGGVDSPELDTGAWLYAVRRLPANITAVSTVVMSTRMLGILDQAYSYSAASAPLPPANPDPAPGHGVAPPGLAAAPIAPPQEGGYVLQNVKTSARRRTTIVLMHGKIFVLLRDSTTDLLDFTSCLCLHTVELQKLRVALLYDAQGIVALRDAVSAIYRRSWQPSNHPYPPTPYDPRAEPRQTQLDVLRSFGRLREEDVEGLLRIWPDDVLWNMWNVVFHHGDYSLFVDRALDTYDADISEAWVDKVAGLTRELMGDWSEEDLDVDIISSNTHSVINILSPFLHAKRDKILEWGRQHKPEVVAANPVGDQDLLYILAQFYFRDPALAKERAEVELAAGIRTLMEEEFTGISLQLFDPSKLDPSLHDENIDIPATRQAARNRKRHLIINIDFAFGRQAEEIIHCLILLFRTSIRSVNVLGKAGGLIGQRGDILIPTHVLLQTQDILTPITNSGLDPAQIAKMSGRTVHIGPVLTIEGTLLQNRALLHYYRRFYHAVGLEMEGSYFARRIVTSIQMGLLKPDVDTRFIYYVSDIPLDTESTLAKSLAPWESIPSLYTTARVVLQQIFERVEVRERLSGRAAAIAAPRPSLPRPHHTLEVVEDADVPVQPEPVHGRHPSASDSVSRVHSGNHLYAGDVFASGAGRRSPLLDAAASSSSSVFIDGAVVQHRQGAGPGSHRRAESGGSGGSLAAARQRAGSQDAAAAAVVASTASPAAARAPSPSHAEWSKLRWGLRVVNSLSYEHTGHKKELGMGIDPLSPLEKAPRASLEALTGATAGEQAGAGAH